MQLQATKLFEENFKQAMRSACIHTGFHDSKAKLAKAALSEQSAETLTHRAKEAFELVLQILPEEQDEADIKYKQEVEKQWKDSLQDLQDRQCYKAACRTNLETAQVLLTEFQSELCQMIRDMRQTAYR